VSAEQRFFCEGFRDYLALEAGHSPTTIESYQRDLRRLIRFAELKGATGPDQVTRGLLRDFLWALKDMGLEPATIRGVRSHTYYGFLLAGGWSGDPSDPRLPRRWRTSGGAVTGGWRRRLAPGGNRSPGGPGSAGPATEQGCACRTLRPWGQRPGPLEGLVGVIGREQGRLVPIGQIPPRLSLYLNTARVASTDKAEGTSC
jgi:hypothetical protein